MAKEDARLGLLRRVGSGPTSLSDLLAQQIEQLIIDENLQMGHRLPSERELVRRFGVSRSVVRDAIAALEQRGLVKARPGSGIFVQDGSGAAVADVFGHLLRRQMISLPELMEARELIEVQTAKLAARRGSDESFQAIASTIRRMESGGSPLEYVEADVAFHEALGQAAGNKVLASVLSALRPLLLEGMLIGTAVAGARQASLLEHKALFEAIRARRDEEAGRLMYEHLRRSYTEWVQAGYIDPGEHAAAGDDTADGQKQRHRQASTGAV